MSTCHSKDCVDDRRCLYPKAPLHRKLRRGRVSTCHAYQMRVGNVTADGGICCHDLQYVMEHADASVCVRSACFRLALLCHCTHARACACRFSSGALALWTQNPQQGGKRRATVASAAMTLSALVEANHVLDHVSEMRQTLFREMF